MSGKKEHIISVEDYSYRYPAAKVNALKEISLQIEKGEFMAIMGSNGAGKTTLCQTLNGIIPLSQGGRWKGQVVVAGQVTHETTVAHLAQEVGVVLQDPESQLFTTKIMHEVAFGPENLNWEVPLIKERVEWALDVVRLKGMEERPPSALSGGQKQRLAIAAALAMQPNVLVLDEPTSQLDPMGTMEVLEVVQELREKYNMTIVIATHKSEEIVKFADRVAVLDDGKLLACDHPRKIFNQIDLIKKAWIRFPQVSELALELAEMDLELGTFPIFLEEMEEALKNLLQGGGKDE